MGVRSSVLAKEIGTTVTSFCTIGWIGIDGHADMLEAYLRDHRAPRMVVYHVAPFFFETADAKIEALGRRKHFREWLAEVQAARAAGVIAHLANPFRFIPSLRLRHPARLRLLHLWGHDEGTLLRQPRGAYPSDDEVRRVLGENDGWMIEPRIAKFPAPTRKRLVMRDDFEPTLRRLFQLTASRGIELVLVMNPQPEVNRAPVLDDDYRMLAGRLEQFARPYAGVRVLTPFLRYYLDEEFVGEPHLNENGAQRNSLEIARWLRDQAVWTP
jgi:hypothetical protein